jgi:aryl-alcohol dehydrogenase-like predicted oxidoreductase
MAALESRPFGRTGERVTAIGLGGAPLGKLSHADGVATVRRALELGITYFDTAPMYGGGASQLILGEALDGRTESYLLATKLGHLASSGDFRSADALRAQLNDNLRRLRRDYVDVLQIHDANWHCWWSDETRPEEAMLGDIEYDFTDAPVLQVLREAKAAGLCRFTGITGNNADAMARVLEGVDVDTCLVAFNYDLIRRRTRREALPLARKRGVALILGGVFQNGRLVEIHPEWPSSPPDWITPELRDPVGRLYTLQRDCGLSLVTLAIRYLMADPDVATILVGAATPAELEESVAAAQEGPLSTELHQAVDALGLEWERSP